MARLLEHQAKALLRTSGVRVPRGITSDCAAGAVSVAEEIGFPVVVKAQVLTGGRGKSGGVRTATTAGGVEAAAAAILGTTLKGHPVREILVEEYVSGAQEAYLAVLTNQASGMPSVLVSLAGGVDVEQIAAESPERIVRLDVDILRGLTRYDALNVVRRAGAVGRKRLWLAALLEKLHKVYRKYDCKLLH